MAKTFILNNYRSFISTYTLTESNKNITLIFEPSEGVKRSHYKQEVSDTIKHLRTLGVVCIKNSENASYYNVKVDSYEFITDEVQIYKEGHWVNDPFLYVQQCLYKIYNDDFKEVD